MCIVTNYKSKIVFLYVGFIKSTYIYADYNNITSIIILIKSCLLSFVFLAPLPVSLEDEDAGSAGANRLPYLF